MAEFDSKKFVFHELFTNTNGKQSSSGFVGTFAGIVGLAAFIACIVGYFLQIPNTLEMIGKVLELLGISGLLLGVRKATGAVIAKKNGDTNGNGNGNGGGNYYKDDIILETPKKG